MPTAAPQTTGKSNAGSQTGTWTDPYCVYNFKLNIQGVNEGHFTECTGLGVRINPISYREAGNNQIIHRLRGLIDYSEVTLRYGLTTSTEMWQWFQSAIRGKVERRDISIIMLNDEGVEVLRWNLLRAWIVEWKGAPLDALGREVAIEMMTLTYEGLDRA